MQPTLQPSSTLVPEKSWEELEARLAGAYDVRGAREAGLSPSEVDRAGNEIIDDLNKEVGPLYDVRAAWESGLPFHEIAQGAKESVDDYRFGTIKAPPERSAIGNLWRGAKEAWAGANPAAESLALRESRGPASRLASAAMMPGRIAVDAALALSRGSTEMGGNLASRAAEAAPGLPAAIPATLGMVAAEGTDVLNFLGPGATARLGEAAAGKAAVVAPGKTSRLMQMFEPEAGKFYHQLTPKGLGETAIGLEGLGRGVGRVVKAGAEGLNRVGSTLRGGVPTPEGLQEALSVVKEQRPPTWKEMGADTRMKDLAEALGPEKAIEAETTLKQELVERRRIELMKRQGMNEEQVAEVLAKEKADKAAQPTLFQKPWEAAKAQADTMMKNPDPVVQAEGRALQDTVKASELSNISPATVDDVFAVGARGPEQGLREESRTFRQFHNMDKEANTLANSVKYFAGRFLADPTSVLPRMAYEAGRVFDRFNRTKYAFYDGVKSAFAGLDPKDKMVTALMLDTHPDQWDVLAKYGLRNEKTDIAYSTTRQLLDRLADVEGLQKGMRVGDYFPHIGLRANKKGIVNAADGQAAWAVPAQSWLPREADDTTGAIQKLISEQSALGETFDPEHLLAIRINAGLRKAYFNPLVKTFEPRLGNLSEGGKAYAEAYINKLLGRPGKIMETIDRAISKVPWKGRTLSVSDLNHWQLGLTMNYYRGLLGLALDTAFKNLGQAQNTIAELGFKNTAKGAGRLFVDTFLTPKSRSVFRNAGVIDDYEHIVAGSMDMLNRAKVWKTMDKILFSPMKFSEYLNRGTAFHAGLARAYEQGLKGNKAVEFARAMVDKTQFRYGVTNTSPYLQNPLGKLAYQFSSYPMKEIQFLNEVIRDPDKRKLYRLLLFHGAVIGGGAAAGANLADAMGYQRVALPFTGDPDSGEERKYIVLPTGIFPHLGIFSAPGMRLGASIPAAVGEVAYKGYPGRVTQELINNIANTLPGRRYIGKLWEISQKLDAGVDTRPPSLPQNVVSLMRGQGIKEYEPGGPNAEEYGPADAAREALGVQPRKRK